jgi:N-acyl-D-amino-acid deacylase
MGTTILSNGKIIDGLGNRPFVGHVFIKDDQIEAVLKENQTLPPADTIIDASDCAIAPGFIDMHSHADWVLPSANHPKLLRCFLEQGITTIVAGNCGISPAPVNDDRLQSLQWHNVANVCHEDPLNYTWHSVGEFLDKIEQLHPVVNVAQLVGHGAIRNSVVNTPNGPMNSKELDICLKELRCALDQGACGLSLGLGYSPGMYSPLEEIEAFCRTAKAAGKPVTVHLKSYAKASYLYPPTIFMGKPHNLRALEEMLNIASQTGMRLQVSHLMFAGPRTWPTAEDYIRMIDESQREGIDVMVDAFPYTCGNTTVDVLLSPGFIAAMPASFSSKWARMKLRYLNEIGFRAVGLSYQDWQLMDAAIEGWEDLSGLTIPEIARKRNTSPFNVMLTLSEASQGATVMLCHELNNKQILELVLSHGLCLFETDAVTKSKGYPNPAALGTFPKILGHYVRERKLFSIEKAIQRMTSASAKRFGITDRGILEPGKAADIVIFNPETVSETPPLDGKPAGQPTGIHHVFVNGTQVVKNGNYTGSVGAGRVLRL